MRVALVVERFEPTRGGVEHAVWRIARELVRSGDEVHVVARRAEGADGIRPHRAEDAGGIRLHRAAAPSFWQPLRLLAFDRAARRALPRDRVDVVHAFSRVLDHDVFHAGGGSHAVYMQRVYGARGARARRLSPRHAVQLALEARILGNPRTLVQCVSERVREELVSRHGVAESRLAVVHYGVDPDRFDSSRLAAARAERRADLGADGETRAWLLPGTGWHRKGLDTALRALARCEDRGARLWVAGRDAAAPWRRLAERLGVAERVRFLGPRRDIERVYAAADGLLLPTRYEPFGMVCLEAAAAGRPVVTSASAGAAELLSRAGVVVKDAEDASAFARALDRLAQPALREQLGARGREVAIAHAWPAQVEKLRALYARVRR